MLLTLLQLIWTNIGLLLLDHTPTLHGTHHCCHQMHYQGLRNLAV